MFSHSNACSNQRTLAPIVCAAERIGSGSTGFHGSSGSFGVGSGESAMATCAFTPRTVSLALSMIATHERFSSCRSVTRFASGSSAPSVVTPEVCARSAIAES
jgi:hypothetical protein